MAKLKWFFVPVLMVFLAASVVFLSPDPIKLILKSIIHLVELKEVFFPSPSHLSAAYRVFEWVVSKTIKMETSLEQARAVMITAPYPPFKELSSERISIPAREGHSILAYWITHKGPNEKKLGDRSILYFHGGAMVMGSAKMELEQAERYAVRCQASVLTIDYRLIPEYTLRELLDDAYDAYLWLHNKGMPFEKIIIMGASGGGMVGFLTLLSLKHWHPSTPLPSRAALLFPCPGMEFINSERGKLSEDVEGFKKWPSWQAARDVLNKAEIIAWAASIVFSNPANLNVYEELFQDLSGLPPIYTSSGDLDTVHNGTVLFAEALRKSGNKVIFNIYPGCFHAFELGAGLTPEADAAIDIIVHFALET